MPKTKKTWSCPICKATVNSQGKNGHLKISHGVVMDASGTVPNASSTRVEPTRVEPEPTQVQHESIQVNPSSTQVQHESDSSSTQVNPSSIQVEPTRVEPGPTQVESKSNSLRNVCVTCGKQFGEEWRGKLEYERIVCKDCFYANLEKSNEEFRLKKEALKKAEEEKMRAKKEKEEAEKAEKKRLELLCPHCQSEMKIIPGGTQKKFCYNRECQRKRHLEKIKARRLANEKK